MSKVLTAKLRPAYQTGNLYKLLQAMTAEQQTQWHQALVRQALSQVEALLTAPEEQHIVAMIRHWIESPSDAQVDGLIDYAFASGLLTAMSNPRFTAQNRTQRIQVAFPPTVNARHVQQLLLAIAPSSLSEAATTVANLAASNVPFTDNVSEMQATIEALTGTARRWQIDAAWAILNDAPVPPLEDRIADDAEGDYRAGNLDKLIARMTEGQKQRLRLGLMQLLLSRLPPLPPLLNEPMRSLLQTCIEAAQRWLTDPSHTNAAELQRAVAAVEAMAPPKLPKGAAVLGFLSDLQAFAQHQLAQVAVNVARTLGQTVSGDLTTVAQSIVELDVTLFAPDMDDELFDEDADAAQTASLPTEPTRKQYEWWQVEAAWAILHDEAVPPLP